METTNKAFEMPTDAIIAYSVASRGANGAPGAIICITADKKIYKYNYIEQNIDINALTAKSGPFIPKYMGLGNTLYIHPEDEAWLNKKLEVFKDDPFYPNGPLFKNWKQFYLE